ncbi:MAG: tyrosine-type recombinase/integrase [Candidatus Obscuribacterales bacterium]|nr:tyrosine-type recombinase/integrase [Candidatus Obscuribacterales bacterium]
MAISQVFRIVSCDIEEPIAKGYGTIPEIFCDIKTNQPGQTLNKSLLKATAGHFAKYQAWLEKQPLSEHSKRAYRSRLNHFLGYLGSSDEHYKDPFKDETERDYILKDYKRFRKQKASPNTVNAALAAADHFYQFLGLPKTKVKREDLPTEAPRALTKAEQKKVIRAAECARRAKDRAVVTLLLYTGIRISECAALNLDDVYAQGRKNRIIVRDGKGGRYREIPLNGEACEAIQAWLQERAENFNGNETDSALFINQQGRRMSTSALDLIVRKVGLDAGVELSAHVLRHTLLTALVRNGNDLVLFAEIGGHKRLEKTRRYSLPSSNDKEKAMSNLTN